MYVYLVRKKMQACTRLLTPVLILICDLTVALYLYCNYVQKIDNCYNLDLEMMLQDEHVILASIDSFYI